MTYLELVNSVLVRLRESQVTSVSDNEYSLLIGKFINDTKRAVEDSFNWDALYTNISIATVSGTSNYTVTGSGRRQKTGSVNDTTNLNPLINVPIQTILDWRDLSTTTNSNPAYYAWNGTDGTDSKVELYPTPDGVNTIKFHLYVPQAELSSDATSISVASEPVILGAYARALTERGEDQGLASSEAYGIYRSSLADHIAIESTRYVENSVWVAC